MKPTTASRASLITTLKNRFTPNLPSLPCHRRSLTMAWRCSGTSNDSLINNLFSASLITTPLVKDAFMRVDRADYAPGLPYEDSPQTIGHGATISAPHMHASACEHLIDFLDPERGEERRVLDVGSGSGYLTHVLAEIAGERGMVVGLEHIQELRDLGEANASKSAEGRKLLETGRMRFRVGDGRKGWIEDGKGEWDVIHVGAAAKEVHAELLAQLKAPGW